MSELFDDSWYDSGFNDDIGAWDTSGVTAMDRMFEDASSFNSDISAWDTSGVTSMVKMFHDASSFNQDIGGWSVGAVLDMEDMFYEAEAFDQNLGWCVDNDVSLYGAFEDALCESTSCGVVFHLPPQHRGG